MNLHESLQQGDQREHCSWIIGSCPDHGECRIMQKVNNDMASILFNCFSISNAHNVKPTTVLSRSPNALLPNQWSSRPSPLVPNSGPSVEEITVTCGPLILHLATEVALECTSTSFEPTYALPSRPRQK